MKNLQQGTIKYLIISIIAISICGIIIYPLFDLLFCKFITNSEFVYSANTHIVRPIIVGIVAGIVFWSFDKNKNNQAE